MVWWHCAHSVNLVPISVHWVLYTVWTTVEHHLQLFLNWFSIYKWKSKPQKPLTACEVNFSKASFRSWIVIFLYDAQQKNVCSLHHEVWCYSLHLCPLKLSIQVVLVTWRGLALSVETGTCCVSRPGPQPQPPVLWDYRHRPPGPARNRHHSISMWGWLAQSERMLHSIFYYFNSNSFPFYKNPGCCYMVLY